MRVAFVTSSAPARTAIGNLLAEKVAFFLDRNAETRVFLESTAGLHPQLHGVSERLDAVPTSGPAWDFLTQSDLVVFEVSVGFDLLGLMPMLAGERPRVVASYYGMSPSSGWPAPQRELLERGRRDRANVWHADAVSVLSRFSAEELTAATGLPGDRIRVHRIPVDLSHWQREPNFAGPHDDDTPHRPVLLSVGRIAPNKRLAMLVEALAEFPTAEAWIVGNDRDVYADEARRLRELATSLGVAERIRWLGDVPDDALPELYRRASVLVVPSIHEGFGIPILEAQAAGLPVVAARATAIPETVAEAGLTFRADDRDDLVRQLHRVLAPRPTPKKTGRVALVSFRFGDGFIGGAETSLRRIGTALQRQGYEVEVFTTCTVRESGWADDLPAGTTIEHGLAVHRFPVRVSDRDRHDRAFQAILERDGAVPADVEAELLEHSIRSPELLAALAAAESRFDAIIATPYLHGLTYDVARTFPDKTILLPCWHDEPTAKLRAWTDAYMPVAGLWHHTPEEHAFAQTVLGLNHPAATVVGSCLPEADRDSKPAEPTRTIVYCGRYSIQKNVPMLLDFIDRYEHDRPGRFRWEFVGEGSVRVPKSASVRDHGRVDEAEKRRILAHADAVVQLSTQESLSLVVLEAWQQATPVIVSAQSPVLVGQLERAGGGVAIGAYDDFARALDDLWNHPTTWRRLGEAGRRFVELAYHDADDFGRRLVRALDHSALPVAEQMRRRGLERAQTWDRAAWREEFAGFVEETLDLPPRSSPIQLTLTAMTDRLDAAPNRSSLLVPIRIANLGMVPALASGPAATLIDVRLRDEPTGLDAVAPAQAPLGDHLLPGKSAVTLVPVELPRAVGRFTLRLVIAGSDADLDIPLTIAATSVEAGDGVAPLLEAAQTALAAAHARRNLPADYLDVCEGRFAQWKRWIKKKLLNNFKRAYVDVLSSQQSDVNRRLVESVQSLSECCRTLDQTVRQLQQRVADLSRKNESLKPRDESPGDRPTRNLAPPPADVAPKS